MLFCFNVVTLAPEITKSALLLGIKPVGISDYCPDVQGAVRLGGVVNPNIEAIVQLKPDILIYSTRFTPLKLKDFLKKHKIKVIALPPAENWREIKTNFIKMAKALNKQKEAEEILTKLEKELKNIKTAKTNLKVLWEIQHNPLVVAGKETLLSSFLEAAGLENFFSQKGYFTVSIEMLLLKKPDIVFTFESPEFWEKLKIKAFHLPRDVFSSPSPEDYVEGVKIICSLLHCH